MERHVLLAAIAIAALVALGVAAYAYASMNKGDAAKPVPRIQPYHGPHEPWWTSNASPQGKCPCPWAPGPRHHGPAAHPPKHEPLARQHHGPRLVLSDEFRHHVLEILMSDNRTAALLNEGYNVTAIKPVIQGVVEGDGTVALHAVKAIVVLREKSGNTHGTALVVVDLVNNRVAKIIEHETTVWGQQG